MDKALRCFKLTSGRLLCYERIGFQATGQSSAGDKRYYSTIREGGAESLQGLIETAGLPKYHTICGPGFFCGEMCTGEVKRKQCKAVRLAGTAGLLFYREGSGTFFLVEY
jgi:hypothetical protein